MMLSMYFIKHLILHLILNLFALAVPLLPALIELQISEVVCLDCGEKFDRQELQVVKDSPFDL